MHFLISIYIGILTAWAFRKRQNTDTLGLWRVGACLVAALVPHLDQLFYLFGEGTGLVYQYTFMWSALLAPVFAFAIAQGFSYISGGHQPESKRTWQRFFLSVFAVFVFNIALAVFSQNGVALLAPLWFGRASLSIIHSFDIGLLIGLLVFTLLGLMMGKWKTDVARVVLVLLIAYVGIVGTFKIKAYNVGIRYGEAMELNVEKVYTLPQPLSPFYWRIVVLTDSGRLHDTRISLKRENPIPLTPGMNAVQRAKASYMPIHAAIWRIYNRYGQTAPDFVMEGWQSDISQSLGWPSRFAVFEKLREYEGMTCAQLKDLRFEGVKSEHLGVYLLCRNKEGDNSVWQAYQAADEDEFFRLDAIY